MLMVCFRRNKIYFRSLNFLTGTINVENVGIENDMDVGQEPMKINCPICRALIKTEVEYNNGFKTYYFSYLLWLLSSLLFR